MRLKKLELQGFKSFAQKTEILFDEGITGIVGPNGSGKSNIGDAVRWVLGEQSAKTLRGASMSDVIFNGTQKRKPQSYCEVSLIFENDDRALNMDFAEIMVTRRVYRNGESEYYLNRASCRLKDIVDLFRDTGIGKEGYSIIGQGRIDEILSRKSEDRRQVFEEAAGIVKFKVRKEEADKKLQRTLDNVQQVENVLAELRRHLGPLEEQSRAAREYIEMSGELKILDLNLFLVRSDRMTTRLAELDEELFNLNVILQDAEASLAEKSAVRDEVQGDIARLEEQITIARDGLMRCAEMVHESQALLSALHSRRETRQENRRRMQEEQEDGARRVMILEDGARRSQDCLSVQEELVADAERMLQQAREESARAEEAAAAADEALEAHKAAVMDAMNRLSAVKNDQTRLKTMHAQMTARLEELAQGEDALKQEDARLEALVADAVKAVEAEDAERQKAADHLEACQQTLLKDEKHYEQERSAAEALSAQLQSDLSRHNLLTEMTRAMEGYNHSVRQAIQWAKKQQMSGVRGVLAQLLSVPQKYETAIDMALGAAQQNIVTDREETAKELISYLRQNKLGRATFLPMTSVRAKTLSDKERQVLKMPGCIGVASELMTFQPEFKGIVENLLGRTVIADNLDHGIAIMRAGNHAFRLVTLEGDVMHSGGSMTGGSTQSKMVNLLSRERELKELTQRLKSGKEEVAMKRQALQEMQQGMAENKQRVAQAMDALHQQEIAVTREQSRENAVRSEQASHRARMEQHHLAAQQLQEAIEEIQQQLDGIGLETGDAQMDQETMEIRTAELQKQQQELRAAASVCADRVMNRTLQLSDLRHELDNLQRDQSRFDQDKEELLESQRRRAQQLVEMDELDQADQAEIDKETEQCRQRQHQQEQQEQVAQALENRRSAAQTRLREVLADIDGLHQVHSRESDRIHRTEMTRARVENDLRTQQNRIWDTYELTYAGAEEFRQTEDFNEKETDRRAAELHARIKALGNVNVNAVDEYAATKARHDDLTAQQEDLRKAEKDLRELIDRLLEQMKSTFVENFTLLQGYFSETFTRLFGGGHAELKLMDPDDPLNCGIEVNAQPPGKKLQLLSLLSGGERALTAIAILFAMLKLKPTPFCMLDEIEAALDDANIGYYADYLKEYSEGTQFIVITHRKGTMERCNSLFGVAMEEQGVSKMVSVSLKDYKE